MLRSADTADYVLPRTRTKFGKRGFCYSGPAAWNSLPFDLHDLTNTTETAQECTFSACLFVTFLQHSWPFRTEAPYKSCTALYSICINVMIKGNESEYCEG